ncbi:hypothetical protein PR048_018944 [Dryococelus australis]|uniref:Uncharacterized protein n=1 Tax=Dryococelus australis TaxID=614101 RepID=A0ABQ9H274_9NEOP|nr:hypothetical protein PR048_018944 [Dryococelus australis]
MYCQLQHLTAYSGTSLQLSDSSFLRLTFVWVYMVQSSDVQYRSPSTCLQTANSRDVYSVQLSWPIRYGYNFSNGVVYARWKKIYAAETNKSFKQIILDAHENCRAYRSTALHCRRRNVKVAAESIPLQLNANTACGPASRNTLQLSRTANYLEGGGDQPLTQFPSLQSGTRVTTAPITRHTVVETKRGGAGNIISTCIPEVGVQIWLSSLLFAMVSRNHSRRMLQLLHAIADSFPVFASLTCSVSNYLAVDEKLRHMTSEMAAGREGSSRNALRQTRLLCFLSGEARRARGIINCARRRAERERVNTPRIMMVLSSQTALHILVMVRGVKSRRLLVLTSPSDRAGLWGRQQRWEGGRLPRDIFAFEGEKRGCDQDYTTTHIKCAIAPMRKTFNCRAVFSSCYMTGQYSLLKAVHGKVSTFEINLREMSLLLFAHILAGALTDMRPLNRSSSILGLKIIADLHTFSLPQGLSIFKYGSVIQRCLVATQRYDEITNDDALYQLSEERFWKLCSLLRDGGETGEPRENPPTSGIARHDSHMQESGGTRPGIEHSSPWLEASRLTAQPPVPHATRRVANELMCGNIPFPRDKQNTTTPHVCNILYVVFILGPLTRRARCDDQRRLTQTRYLRTMFWYTRSPIPGRPRSAAAITRASSSSSDTTGVLPSNRATSTYPLLAKTTLLDYFLWGYMKGMNYKTPVESEEDLLARVMAAADLGRPGIGDRVYQNMVRRYRVCVRRRWSSHRALLGEPGSIPGRATPGSSHVEIVPDDAAGRRVFSGISRIPNPCFPALLHACLNHPHWLSLLRATHIYSFTHSSRTTLYYSGIIRFVKEWKLFTNIQSILRGCPWFVASDEQADIVTAFRREVALINGSHAADGPETTVANTWYSNKIKVWRCGSAATDVSVVRHAVRERAELSNAKEVIHAASIQREEKCTWQTLNTYHDVSTFCMLMLYAMLYAQIPTHEGPNPRSYNEPKIDTLKRSQPECTHRDFKMTKAGENSERFPSCYNNKPPLALTLATLLPGVAERRQDSCVSSKCNNLPGVKTIASLPPVRRDIVGNNFVGRVVLNLDCMREREISCVDVMLTGCPQLMGLFAPSIAHSSGCVAEPSHRQHVHCRKPANKSICNAAEVGRVLSLHEYPKDLNTQQDENTARLALKGDGAFNAHGRVALIALSYLGLERRK